MKLNDVDFKLVTFIPMNVSGRMSERFPHVNFLSEQEQLMLPEIPFSHSNYLLLLVFLSLTETYFSSLSHRKILILIRPEGCILKETCLFRT